MNYFDMTTHTQLPIDTNAAASYDAAKRELTKLPLLGPALWLFARDAHRRYTFVADMDWRLMPPLVLDQCRLFSKADLPWGFVTWAMVSDVIDQRLSTGAALIAPHEWQSGSNPWLIDVVAPFGDSDVVAVEVAKSIAPGKVVRAWLPNSAGQLSLKELAPHV